MCAPGSVSDIEPPLLASSLSSGSSSASATSAEAPSRSAREKRAHNASRGVASQFPSVLEAARKTGKRAREGMAAAAPLPAQQPRSKARKARQSKKQKRTESTSNAGGVGAAQGPRQGRGRPAKKKRGASVTVTAAQPPAARGVGAAARGVGAAARGVGAAAGAAARGVGAAAATGQAPAAAAGSNRQKKRRRTAQGGVEQQQAAPAQAAAAAGGSSPSGRRKKRKGGSSPTKAGGFWDPVRGFHSPIRRLPVAKRTRAGAGSFAAGAAPAAEQRVDDAEPAPKRRMPRRL
jgi:hypothetical protein